ncbi:MAG: ribokinase [Oligoflexia bacterium]|nr:ribokinase [Oligoflexia bacterium]
MKKILVVGSLNMDLVVRTTRIPKIGETVIGVGFDKIPGGKGANQATAVAKLGGEISFIGKVGADNFGEELTKKIMVNKIDTSGIMISKTDPTGMASITVDDFGNNSIVVVSGANFDITKEDIDSKFDMITSAEIIILQLEIPLEIVKYIISKAKTLGKTVILNPAPAVVLDSEVIEKVDFLIPNETELEILTGINSKSIDDVILSSRQLIEKGANKLIVTLGEKGAIYIDRAEIKHYPSYKVNVVDTTAAGDAFIGGFATFLSKGAEIDEAIKFAIKVGALTVTKHGAQVSIPTLEEVTRWNRYQGSSAISGSAHS